MMEGRRRVSQIRCRGAALLLHPSTHSPKRWVMVEKNVLRMER
jgi:hypothetical protein